MSKVLRPRLVFKYCAALLITEERSECSYQFTRIDVAEMMPVDVGSYLVGDLTLIHSERTVPCWVWLCGGASPQICQLFERGLGRHSATHCSALAHLSSTVYPI